MRLAILLIPAYACFGQTFELRPVEPVRLATLVDSNTPVFWRDGRYHAFSSSGTPLLNAGPEAFQLNESRPVQLSGSPEPLWVESVWEDADGTLFLWYHHEVTGICPGLAVPRIGAAVSFDGGRSMTDLGFVLESGHPPDCSAKNGYFAGGHGDFTVIHNPADDHFYFFFSTYDGDVAEQGVAVARMRADRRYSPAGAVWKHHAGEWNQPGLGGRVTPVFPAQADWRSSEADSYWGPAVHWNTYLNQFVMLLNRSCCTPGWPQAGVFISFSKDLSKPESWPAPEILIGAGEWYPQVQGTGPGETDRVAGQRPRLFVRGFSDWEIVFSQPDPEMPASSVSKVRGK
ncbi:MAG: hypothetical protein FJW31_13995 [Acidobacteria bacterium]|nr:hypothetical protein [Acidobacteriota bacterium]